MTEQKDLIEVLYAFWFKNKHWNAEVNIQEELGYTIKAKTLAGVEVEIIAVTEDEFKYIPKGGTAEDADYKEHWELENDTLSEICNALEEVEISDDKTFKRCQD